MSSNDNDREKGAASTRRSFLKGGALLAAPLAAAVPAAIIAEDGTKARLAKLENEAAIRELHQAWLRSINTGARDEVAGDPSVRRIAPDHAGEPDAIEVAADGKRASGRFHCAVQTETAIEQDCTLAQMARAQGGGYVRRSERRVLHVQYAKASGAWAIAKAEFSAA
ncbi:MAG TPA: hypothetical protein VHX36_01985 [Candidatus Acidoferrales bacterium]|jgi:hypothetical protein|nr:hypothetical protein [Candidatus Acidoferrales bacterium]